MENWSRWIHMESLLAAPKDPLRLSPPLRAPSGQVLEAVRKLGLQGVVGKRIASIYESGQRSGAWIARTWSKSSSLAVTFPVRPVSMRYSWAFTRTTELILSRKVKNGFVRRIRDELFPALKALQTAKCPFKNLPEKRASRCGESLTAEKMEQYRWVKPKLVCQVAFVEWTDAGHLRHSPSSPCAMTRSLRRWFAKLELAELETEKRL